MSSCDAVRRRTLRGRRTLPLVGAHRSHPIVQQAGQTLYASYPVALEAGDEMLPAGAVRLTLRRA